MKIAVFALSVVLVAGCWVRPAHGLVGGNPVMEYLIHFRSHVAVFFPFGESLWNRQAVGGLIHPRFVLCFASFFDLYADMRTGIKVMIGSVWMFHGGNLYDVDYYEKIGPLTNNKIMNSQRATLLRLAGEFMGPERNSHIAFMPSYGYAPQAKVPGVGHQVFQMAGWHGAALEEDNWLSHRLNALKFKRHNGKGRECHDNYNNLEWIHDHDGSWEDSIMDCYFHLTCKNEKVCRTYFTAFVYDDGAPVMAIKTNIMVGTVANREAYPKSDLHSPVMTFATKNYQNGLVKAMRALRTDMYDSFPDDALNNW